jgi:heme-degrading monooxygenase HmoA
MSTVQPAAPPAASSVPGAAPFAPRPDPPYYAVIFASQRRSAADADADGYGHTAERMVALAAGQPGYLGVESARGDDGFGITVSYWQSLEAIAAWRRQIEHAAARDRGRSHWYEGYELRISRVERAYGWRRAEGHPADPAPAGAPGMPAVPGAGHR